MRGHADPPGPTVGDVADYLVLRLDSAGGLVDPAAAAALVTRSKDRDNSSAVACGLTTNG